MQSLKKCRLKAPTALAALCLPVLRKKGLTFFPRFYIIHTHSQNGPLAQLVEQQTLNLWVAGSKPAWLKFPVKQKSTDYRKPLVISA